MWEFNDGTTTYTLPRTTTDLTEGTNLYFTTDRANAAVADYDGDITTTGNITGGYIIAGNDAGGEGIFLGDINGAIQQEVRNTTGNTIVKGKAVYLTGVVTGDTPHVALANAEVVSKMPAIGIVKNQIPNNQTGEIVTGGQLNIGTHSFTIGSQLFINGAGDLTETIPTGEGNLVQKIGKVVTAQQIIVQGAGRTNATPNLDQGNIFLGNGSNKAVTAVFNVEANSAIGNYLTLGGGESDSQVVRTSDDRQPVAAVDNGFQARQASGSSGDSANIWSIPRFSTYKGGPNTDWSAGTVTESTPNTLGGAFSFDSARYRKLVVGGSTSAQGITNISTTAVVSEIGTQEDINASWFGGFITSDHSFTPGTISFRTAQRSVADELIASNDYIYFTNLTATDKAAVMYLDDKVHIGRPDSASLNYSLPKTPGSTDDFLLLDGSNDLQWNGFTTTITNKDLTFKQYNQTVVALGSVVGDISTNVDSANGTIFTLTATGGITLNSIANAVAGTSVTIKVIQDGTGSHALSSTMKFEGGDKTLSTASGAIDVITVFYDGTDYLASLTKAYA